MAQRSFRPAIARFRDGTTFANVDDPVVPAQFRGWVAPSRASTHDAYGAGYIASGPPTRSSLLQLQPELLALADAATASGIFPPSRLRMRRVRFLRTADMRTFYDETVGTAATVVANVSRSSAPRTSRRPLTFSSISSTFPDQCHEKWCHGTNPGRKGDGNERKLSSTRVVAFGGAPEPQSVLSEPRPRRPIGDDVTQQSKTIRAA